MIGHDTPGMNLQAFLFSTIGQAFNNYVTVFLSGKNVDPANNGKRNEMDFLLIPDLISSNAHSQRSRC